MGVPTSIDAIASEGLSPLEVGCFSVRDGVPKPIFCFSLFFKPHVSIFYNNCAE